MAVEVPSAGPGEQDTTSPVELQYKVVYPDNSYGIALLSDPESRVREEKYKLLHVYNSPDARVHRFAVSEPNSPFATPASSPIYLHIEYPPGLPEGMAVLDLVKPVPQTSGDIHGEYLNTIVLPKVEAEDLLFLVRLAGEAKSNQVGLQTFINRSKLEKSEALATLERIAGYYDKLLATVGLKAEASHSFISESGQSVIKFNYLFLAEIIWPYTLY